MKTNLKTLQINKKFLLEQKKLKQDSLTKFRIEERNVLQDIEKIDKQIAEIDSKIEKILTKVVVSEHATLRYIERIMGIDIREVQSKILTEETKNMIDKLGNGKYPIDGGFITVEDNVVVTVIPKN